MAFLTDYILEDYIINTNWENLPEKVRERAVMCAIDLTAALILGSRGRQFAAGLSLVEDIYRSGDVPVIGCEKTFNFMGAVVLMGHAANSFDIDDGHNMIRGHPGAAVIAGTLAAALEKRTSYQDFLVALVIAYEAAIRNGLALQDHYKYLHSSGAYGAFGTAAGIGKIYGLGREKLNTALSIADFHAPMVPVMRAVTYPSMNKDGVPFGSLVGAMAVRETLAGTTGKTHLLESEEYRALLDSLGKDFEILNLYFKPYTCCRWAHQPITAVLDLLTEYDLQADKIKRVTVHTFGSAAKLSKQVPSRTDEAQYNIAYPIAAAIIHGDVGYLQVTEESLNNRDVISLMERMDFVIDPELERQFPEKRLARVDLCLFDGSVYSSKNYQAPGEVSDGITIDWIKEKFARVTAPFLTEAHKQAILGRMEQTHGSIREIVELINKSLL